MRLPSLTLTQLSTICLPSNTISPNLNDRNIYKSAPSNQLTQLENTHTYINHHTTSRSYGITYPFSHFLIFDCLSLSYKSFALSISNINPKHTNGLPNLITRKSPWIKKLMNKKKTWELTELPPRKQPIVKLKYDGSIERYKAHLLTKGYKQQEGVD
ncbi:hypothetical protein CR513_62044, partial [Mucuna pruriens]